MGHETQKVAMNLPKPSSNFEICYQRIYASYYYKGGLTTPVCNEIVLWTVFSHKLNVTKKNLEIFNRAKTLITYPNGTMETGQLTNNFRPPQPLHGRTVYVNKDPSCCARKIVGDIEYVLKEEAMDKKDLPKGCLNKYIYTLASDPTGQEYCFKAGQLPVTCITG